MAIVKTLNRLAQELSEPSPPARKPTLKTIQAAARYVYYKLDNRADYAAFLEALKDGDWDTIREWAVLQGFEG